MMRSDIIQLQLGGRRQSWEAGDFLDMGADSRELIELFCKYEAVAVDTVTGIEAAYVGKAVSGEEEELGTLSRIRGQLFRDYQKDAIHAFSGMEAAYVGNAVSGEGIRAAGARMLVRDLLLKSQNEALTEELVAEHAKQMLKTASADGHSISLTEFVQYAGQHRALFDQLLLQQRSSAPCGTMTDVDAVNINGDTVPAPLVCSSSIYYRRRPRAACSVPVHAVCML